MNFRKSHFCVLLSILVSLFTAGCQSTKESSATGSEQTAQEVRFKTLIISEPKAATFYLNDREIGTTPCSFEFPNAKSIKVKFKKDGYWAIVDVIEQAIDGWPTSLAYRMQRKIKKTT